jgi:hypothetical protein
LLTAALNSGYFPGALTDVRQFSGEFDYFVDVVNLGARIPQYPAAQGRLNPHPRFFKDVQ